MLKLIYVLVLMSMSACASFTWDKDGATQAEFAKDDYACRRDAIAAGGAYVSYGSVQRRPDLGMYRMCMQASGYTLRH